MNLQSIGLVSAALAPALVILGGINLRTQAPYVRSWSLIASALLAGCVASYVALGAETALMGAPTITNLGGLALFTVMGIGLIEEGAKFLLLWLVLWRLAGFREAYDGIVLAAGVGLGFGGVENIFYVLNAEGEGYGTALVRAFTAVPLHGSVGIIMGYYLGQAKVWEGIKGRTHWGFLGTGLTLAAVGHGVYDFFAFQTSPLAEALLWGALVGLMIWSWQLIGRSRNWSPSWGGQTLIFAETLFIPPPLIHRDPWLAGFLGLIPGLGQFYNREVQKGICLALAGLINIFMLGGLWWLLQAPEEVLLLLLSWGLLIGPDPDKLIVLLAQGPLLGIVATLMLTLSIFGSMDAYQVARNNQFDYLQAPAQRRTWVQAVSLAYGGHLLAVVLLVLVPILGGGGSQGQVGEVPAPPPIIFDLVTEPTSLMGHSQQADGQPNGKDKTNQKAQPALVPDTKGAGQGRKAQPPTTEQNAKGIPHSYSDYISGELRREQEHYDIYFTQLLPGEYTVVRYTISPSGEVYDAEVLWDHTTAPPTVAQLALQEIERLSPLLAPPSQGRELIVTELFWQNNVVGSPGSLEYQLSRLSDGRMIEIVE